MALQLKNPGTDTPKNLSFDSIPHPLEFLKKGGVPGIEYLYLLAEEQATAYEEGWSPIVGVPPFRIRGMGATMMARGTPIDAGQPGASKCKFYVSKALRAAANPDAVLPPKAADSPSSTVNELAGNLPKKASQNPALQKSAS